MSCYRVLTSAVMSPAYHLKINDFRCKKNTKLGGRGRKVRFHVVRGIGSLFHREHTEQHKSEIRNKFEFSKLSFGLPTLRAGPRFQMT